MGSAIAIAVVLISALGIGLGVEHFFDDEHYNLGFYEFPMVISLHVGLGAVYLVLALLQFVDGIRRRKPILHRLIGRTAVVTGLVTAVTAVVAIVLFPFSGPAMIFFVAPFAGYFAFALVYGLRAARRKEFVQHRAWMVRAFAIASAIATQRLILVPSLMVFGTEPETIRIASMLSFTGAFLIHAAISEYWLSLKKRAGEALPVGS